MDFLALARTIFRRWYIAVPILLLTVAAATVTHSRLERTYVAEGQIMLASPAAAALQESFPPEGAAGGDTLGAPRSAPVTSRVVAELVMAGEIRDRLRERGATAAWELDVQSDDSIIRVNARSASEDDVVPTVQEVLRVIEEVVAEREESTGVPEAARSSVEILAAPTTPEARQSSTDMEFAATGSLMLVRPSASDAAETPYGASRFTAQVLERVMRSDQAASKVAALGARSTYEIKIDRRDTANIFYVTTTGTQVEDVLGSFRAVMQVLEEELFARQAASGFQPGSTAQLEPLATPTTVRDTTGNQMRGIVVILGLGITAAFSAALFAEGFLTRRPPPRQRRRVGIPQDDESTSRAFEVAGR